MLCGLSLLVAAHLSGCSKSGDTAQELSSGQAPQEADDLLCALHVRLSGGLEDVIEFSESSTTPERCLGGGDLSMASVHLGAEADPIHLQALYTDYGAMIGEGFSAEISIWTPEDHHQWLTPPGACTVSIHTAEPIAHPTGLAWQLSGAVDCTEPAESQRLEQRAAIQLDELTFSSFIIRSL